MTGRRGLPALALLLAAVLAAADDKPAAQAQVPAQPQPLPLKKFVEPYGAVAAAISPDGQHIALIEHQGVSFAVKLVQLSDLSARVIVRGRWAADGFHLINRNPRAISWVTSQWLAVDYGIVAEAIDLKGQRVAELGTRVIGKAVPADPESTLMLVYDDDDFETVAQVDVKTRRKLRLRYPMDGKPHEWSFDERGALRTVLLADSPRWGDETTLRLWYRPHGREDWVMLATYGVGDERLRPLAASAQRDELVVASRQGRDTRAIQRIDPLRLDQPPVTLFEHPQHDVASSRTLRGQAPLGYFTAGLKRSQRWLDEAWDSVQIAIDQVLPDRVNVLSGHPEGQVLVFSYGDVDPGRWYVLDVPKEELRWLATTRQAIDPKQMRPMQTLSYRAGDGLVIPAYLTLPAARAASGVAPGPVPTVVLVHGGPAIRDHWEWNLDVQLLASRGYAVFQPQFRGSTGFGRSFEKAGHGQWGLAMQDDISAGVRHLIDSGVADATRICIVGASYGGYAAVWGLIKTPELYRCGATMAGVADIGYMLTDWSDRNDDKITREILRLMVGERSRDQAKFDAVSPLKYAARVQAPLLIAHGDDDVRVPYSHATKLRSALDAAGRPYEWLRLRDEGHGLSRVDTQLLYYEKLLGFLDRHIGPAASAAAAAPAAPAASTPR